MYKVSYEQSSLSTFLFNFDKKLFAEMEDNFRKAEKEVKKYFSLKEAIPLSNKERRRLNRLSTEFDINDAVDVHNILFSDRFSEFPVPVALRSPDISERITICEINGTPQGFYVLRDALTFRAQCHWAKTAVEKYSKSLHTNLTNLEKLGKSEITSEEIETLWEDSVRDNNDFKRFESMRWASLGYHYDWTARKYSKDIKSTFPCDFAELLSELAGCVDQVLKPEAAIINYYPCGSVMSGHIDDAEHAMNEPLVSLSIGCPCVFLIGGRTKDIVPVSLLLRSGDVVIMSGESRYCYHAVASVFSHKYLGTLEDSFRIEEYPRSSVDPILKYLLLSRVNLNARRVAKENCDWVDKCGTGAMNSYLNS